MAGHDAILSVRMTQRLVDRIDEVSEEVGNNLTLFPGGMPSRNQMIRQAIVKGLRALREENDGGDEDE